MKRSSLPRSNPAARAAVPDATRVAAWGLAFWGGAQLAATIFERNATAMVAVQAAIAEWGAGRVGITWSDPLAPPPTWRDIRGRVTRGAALGVGGSLLVVAAALASHRAAIASVPPAASLLAVGLITAALSAVRDELFLRGVVLRVAGGLMPRVTVLLVCGAVGAAARWGVEGGGTTPMIAEAFRAVVLGAIWMRDRGAWMACAANATWTWSLGSIVRGGLIDVRFGIEPESGMPTLVVLGAAAFAAVVWTLRLAGDRKTG